MTYENGRENLKIIEEVGSKCGFSKNDTTGTIHALMRAGIDTVNKFDALTIKEAKKIRTIGKIRIGLIILVKSSINQNNGDYVI